MKFGSVCSGIEAESVAWNPLGWAAAWFSEIEPFPRAVLAHHYPTVPNHGDMTMLPERILSGEVEAPDVLCGGTPCQAFSVAGKRRSLDDDRGNLSLVFCEVADAIDTVRAIHGKRAALVFWENVPGVLSTKDNAFGCFLAELVGADAPLSSGAGRWPSAGVVAGPKRKAAWRVLDAQHFGVPQRRRRVFVVASARNDINPAKILFERAGVRGNPQKSGQAREGVTGYVESSFGTFRADTVGGTTKASGGVLGGGSETLVVFENHGQDSRYKEVKIAPTCTARYGTGGGNVPLVLAKEPPRFFNTHLSYGVVRAEETCKTLTAQMANQTDMPIVLSENGTDRAVGIGVTPPLKTTTTPCFCESTVAQVRRLTPVECERLQGFPDNYTRIPYRGKQAAECPDSPRYKALGNSWAVPVVRWIGKRINEQIKEAST